MAVVESRLNRPRTMRDIWDKQSRNFPRRGARRAPFTGPLLNIKTGGSRGSAAGRVEPGRKAQPEVFVYDSSKHVVQNGYKRRLDAEASGERALTPGIEIKTIEGETLYMTVRCSGVTFTGPFEGSSVDYGQDSAIWSSPVRLDGRSNEYLLLLYVVAREFGVEIVRVQDVRERIFKRRAMGISDIQKGVEIYEHPLFHQRCLFPLGYNQSSMRVDVNYGVVTALFDPRV